MNVFCCDCIFYVEGERIPFPFGDPKCFDKKHFDIEPGMIPCEKKEQCLSPHNFKNSHNHENNIPVSIPAVINQFNSCKWFEPKENPSSSSSGVS